MWFDRWFKSIRVRNNSNNLINKFESYANKRKMNQFIVSAKTSEKVNEAII
jgi:hypothetical protein